MSSPWLPRKGSAGARWWWMTPQPTGSATMPGCCWQDLGDLGDRVTLVRNGARRGGLFNTWNAIANFCGDPNSVIITLDADDALIGRQVLDRVGREYEDGADATVGSMLRLDKEASLSRELREAQVVGQQRVAAPSNFSEEAL